MIPGEEGAAGHKIGPLAAGGTMFKDLVGPGLLFLPSGVKNAGLAAAVAISASVGAASTFCLLLVLDSAAILRRAGVPVASLGDVGATAYSRAGRLAAEASIAASQLGFCTAYCVFVAENVQAVAFEAHGGRAVGEDDAAALGLAPCELPGPLGRRGLVYYVILAVVPLLVPLTWVRHIKRFNATNAIANFLVCATVVYMFASFFRQLAGGRGAPRSELRAAAFPGALVYFGTAMYAFEGGEFAE